MLTFMRQSIKRIRPGVKESRGSQVQDWDNAEETVIHGCCVQPEQTEMSMDGRVLGLTEGRKAYLPYGADVRAGDRIEFEGETYLIDGSPRRWRSTSGKLDHVLLNLKRWEG